MAMRMPLRARLARRDETVCWSAMKTFSVSSISNFEWGNAVAVENAGQAVAEIPVFETTGEILTAMRGMSRARGLAVRVAAGPFDDPWVRAAHHPDFLRPPAGTPAATTRVG